MSMQIEMLKVLLISKQNAMLLSMDRAQKERERESASCSDSQITG